VTRTSVRDRRSKMEEIARSEEDVSVKIVELSAEDIVAQSMVETTTIMADEGDKNKCPRCSGKVFEAEKMTSNKSIFHRKCFTCQDCRRALDASLVNDGPEDGTIFCSTCYQRKFGPTVRILLQVDEDNHQPTNGHGTTNGHAGTTADPSLKSCHKCHKVVYVAEENVTNGRSYHKICTKCHKCNRQLDMQTIHDAPDQEIYCSGCYSRLFGTSGYRGIQSSVWTDNSEQIKSVRVKESTPMRGTPAIIEVNKDSCIRCNRSVYDAEKVLTKFGFFHQGCYNCHNCHVKLDSSRACELGQSKEIFCKNCYNAKKGLAGYGYGSVYMTSSQEVKQQYHFTQFF